MYLGEWTDKIGMVAEFEGLYVTSEQFHDPAKQFEGKTLLSVALQQPRWQEIEVLLARYSQEGYEGSAFVLFTQNGELYEVNASHCSCFGLEGQWEPEETTWQALYKRTKDGWSFEDFKEEMYSVLGPLAAAHMENILLKGKDNEVH